MQVNACNHACRPAHASVIYSHGWYQMNQDDLDRALRAMRGAMAAYTPAMDEALRQVATFPIEQAQELLRQAATLQAEQVQEAMQQVAALPAQQTLDTMREVAALPGKQMLAAMREATAIPTQQMLDTMREASALPTKQMLETMREAAEIPFKQVHAAMSQVAALHEKEMSLILQQAKTLGSDQIQSAMDSLASMSASSLSSELGVAVEAAKSASSEPKEDSNVPDVADEHAPAFFLTNTHVYILLWIVALLLVFASPETEAIGVTTERHTEIAQSVGNSLVAGLILWGVLKRED